MQMLRRTEAHVRHYQRQVSYPSGADVNGSSAPEPKPGVSSAARHDVESAHRRHRDEGNERMPQRIREPLTPDRG
jgi:hypothetical protein